MIKTLFWKFGDYQIVYDKLGTPFIFHRIDNNKDLIELKRYYKKLQVAVKYLI